MTANDSGFFAFLTPAEIYDQLTGGRGPEQLSYTQRVLLMETLAEEDRAHLIAAIGELTATGWQGEASATARGSTLPLRDHVLANADKLDQAQDLLSRQAGSFQTAYHSVRPISGPPGMPLDESFPFDVDHEKDVAGYQADAQHNMAVFEQYDGASEYNETNMPQEFHGGRRGSGDILVKSPDTIEVGDSSPREGGPDGGIRESGWPGRHPGGGPYPGGHPSTSGPYPGNSSPYPGNSGGSDPGGTSPSGGFHARPDDFRPSPGYSYPVSGQQGAPAASDGFVGGVPGGGHPGRGSSGGFGPGGGIGSRGVSGILRSGAAAGGSGGGASGPVLRGPGVGAGALAAEEAAARRAAQAAAGRGGAGPMGAPAGGGRGKDEDAEHERKVLIEADPEETFGSEVLTAPQVIGDEEYED